MKGTGGVFGGGEGFDGIPVHEGEVLVGDIFGVGGQSFDNRPSILQRRALHGGGEVEADVGGGIGFGKVSESGQGRGSGMFVFGEELDGPAADVFVAVVEKSERLRFVQGVDAVKRPEGAELASDVGVVGEDLVKRFTGFLAGAAFLENAAGVADIPFVRAEMQLDELGVGEFVQIDFGRMKIAVGHAIDAAVFAVGIVAVAFAGVGP